MTAHTPEPLTERQQQIVALVRENLTNAQIARRLYIQTGTVEQHLTAIYTRLGITGRSELTGGIRR